MGRNLYSDLDLSFKPHPVSGDILLKTNKDAVKKSVRNLILLSKYEKPFQPEIHSGVRELLFENVDSITALNIRSNIEDVLRANEPRISLKNVLVYHKDEDDFFEITVVFSIRNENELIKVTTPLEILR